MVGHDPFMIISGISDLHNVFQEDLRFSMALPNCVGKPFTLPPGQPNSISAPWGKMESKLLHNTMQFNEQDKQKEGGEK